MKDSPPQRFRFGVFEIDLRAGEVRNGNGAVVLPDQPFQILRMLIEHAGEVVTRQEIRRRLWPNDTVVEFDHSINAAVNKLRQAFGDAAVSPKYIETVARRGYRLVVVPEPIAAPDLNGEDSTNVAQVAGPVFPALPAASANLIGKKVSHYRVANVIGVGGMGLVYEAEDLRLGRAVALKFLPEDLAQDPAALKRFEREARAASSLDHFNICTIYGVEEHEGEPFIVMQRLCGQTLRDRLSVLQAAQQTIPVSELLEIAIQICDGLAAAHANGIIHRDVKPANIFLTTQGQVKILDFGLAKLAEAEEFHQLAIVAAASGETRLPADTDLTRTGLTLGTAGYMSPEQVRGEELDLRTDLFSLGLVMYEMATGQRAFSGETAVAVKEAIQHETPVPLSERNLALPAPLETIVNRAMEKDREHRYQSAPEMRAELLTLRDNSRHLEPERTLNGSRWRSIAGAALILAVVAGWPLANRVQRPKLAQGDTIVIASIVNRSNDPILGPALQTPLLTKFNESPFLDILAGEKIREGLRALNEPETADLTPALAEKLCRATNSKAVVQSSISDDGNRYAIELVAKSCANDAQIARIRVDSSSRDVIVRSLGEAGAEMRTQLGEPATSIQDFNKPLDEATSRSLEALAAASFASKLRYAGASVLKALPYYEKAIDLDPNYAMVYKDLAILYINAGESAKSKKSLGAAFALRDRLTTRDRCAVEPNYYHIGIGDIRKAIEISKKCVDTYPWDFAARDYLGAALRIMGQFEPAAVESRVALRSGITFSRVYNLMLSRMAMNRLQQAKETYEEVNGDGLKDPEVAATRYLLAFCNGDEPTMQQQVSKATAVAGREPPVLLAKERDTAAYRGQFRKARTLSLRAEEVAKQDGKNETRNALIAEQALLEVEVGNNTEAMQMLEPITPPPEQSYVAALKALVWARAGDSRLQGLLGRDLELSVANDKWVQEYWSPAVWAASDLRAGHPEHAIQRLKATEPIELGAPDMWDPFGFLYPAYLRGLVYLQAGNGRAAAAEFEKINSHNGLVANFIIGSLARLGLARAELLMADKASARRLYHQFLTLWEDADPDIPIYRQAKAEYAKLQ